MSSVFLIIFDCIFEAIKKCGDAKMRNFWEKLEKEIRDARTPSPPYSIDLAFPLC